MADDNSTICEAIEEAQQALQRARSRFKKVYPEADLAEDTFYVRARSIDSQLEDLAYGVENR